MRSVEVAAQAGAPGGDAAFEPNRFLAAPAAAVGAAAAIVLAGLVVWIQPGEATLAAIAALAIGALVASVWALVAYRRGVAGIHRAVQEAHGGRLAPIALTSSSRALLGRLADDYNALARDLGSLFGEMEQAQLSIIGERNRHEAILQSLPGALLIVRVDLRVTRANRQAQTLFGLPDQALDGTNLLDLLRTDDAGTQALRDAFLHAQPLRNALLAMGADEDQRRLSVNLTFFKQTKNASESCAVIILQDVTEYKRLEELTHQTEKLVAMGQLAAGVAHELNTPLGTILGYAHLLNEGKASEERRVEYARVIHSETRRCARIVDDLLAYARHRVCPRESCEINALILEATEAVANCQGRRLGVAIETELPATAVVRGGSGQLDIVLVNLLVNATQAASASAEPRVRVNCSVEGDFAVVAVTDNGPGVPAQNQRRIFDPFFTTKVDGMGTGLGLALSHSIVARIGGTLRCDPSHRGGARFLLSLPLAH